MSIDFDLTLLLSQAKDDPRFQRITSNSVRLGTAQLSADPLLFATDNLNQPFLGGVSTNTPQFLDVRLDLLFLLKENIDNTRMIAIDKLHSLIQTKQYLTTVDVRDTIQSLDIDRVLRDSIHLSDKFNVSQNLGRRDVLDAQDKHELDLGKTLKEFTNSVNSIKKLLKLEMHGAPVGSHYPNYKLANRVSKDYGMIAGLGRDVTSIFPLPNQRDEDYEFVQTSQPAGTPILPAGTFGQGYWKSPGGFQSKINSQNPPDPLGDLSNKHVLYGDENGVVALAPYRRVGMDPDYSFAPFWNRDEINNRFGEWADGIAGYVYWWMPGYVGELGPLMFTDEAYTGIPDPVIFNGFSNRINRSGNLYFYDVKNGSFPPTNIGHNIPFDPSGAIEVISARTLPSNHSVALPGPGTIAYLVDKILEIVKVTNLKLPTLSINARSSVLAGRNKDLSNRISVKSIPKLEKRHTLKNQVAETNSRIQFFAIGRPQNSKSKVVDSNLAAKAKLPRELIRSLDRKGIAIVKSDALKSGAVTLSKASKDVRQRQVEFQDIRSSFLVNPANIELLNSKFSIKDTKELDVGTNLLNLLNLTSFTSKHPNKSTTSFVFSKDFVLNPKAALDFERINTSTETFLKAILPRLSKLDLKSFESRHSNKSLREFAEIRDNISVPRAPSVQSSLVSVLSFFKFVPDMKFESSAEFVKHFDIRDVHKIPKTETADLKSSTLTPLARIKTSSVGVKSEDRDQGSIGDVFFTFGTGMSELAEFSQRVTKDFDKNFPSLNLKIVTPIIQGKARYEVERLLIKDTRHGHKVGKALQNKLYILDHKVEKDYKKPIKTVGDLRDLIINDPNKFNLLAERFIAKDDFNPWLFIKNNISVISVSDSDTKDITQSIHRDTFSSSETGYIWARDEEYTEGAYFLQPYVAAIPPGRSRQF